MGDIFVAPVLQVRSYGAQWIKVESSPVRQCQYLLAR